MDFVIKIFVFCAVFCVALCYADKNHYGSNGEACMVQYLIAKGKLDPSFQSTVQPSLGCHLVIPLAVQVLKSNVKHKTQNVFPYEAACLTDAFDNREAFGYLIQLDLIKISSLLSASDRRTQLEVTKNEFDDLLEEIAHECLVDHNKFIRIFNEHFGTKNETLEVYQREYCLAKYVVDNQLMQLNNWSINPHYIDPDSVNCDGIIDAERNKTENELSDKLTATEAGQRSLDCVMDAFKSANVFGYKIAFAVLNNIELTSEVKEIERHKISKKLEEFAVSTIRC